MGGIHALDQPHLFFYVHPLHDNSCHQVTSIKHELHESFTNYTNAEGDLIMESEMGFGYRPPFAKIN